MAVALACFEDKKKQEREQKMVEKRPRIFSIRYDCDKETETRMKIKLEYEAGECGGYCLRMGYSGSWQGENDAANMTIYLEETRDELGAYKMR